LVKKLDEFPKVGRVCKRCHLDRSIEERRDNRPGAVARRKSSNDALARRKYGLTQQEVDALRAIDTCQICDKPSEVEGTALPIDHDHKTGKVRGVLCRACNRGVGFFQDDPTLLRAAADYLEACI
jgi:hypothetical protein